MKLKLFLESIIFGVILVGGFFAAVYSVFPPY